MNEFNHQQKLVMAIADYLTDWTDDETSVLPIEESIQIIESYGVKFDEPCDDLVVNAIRHFANIINPWSKDVIPDILMDESLGFTKEECDKYF